MAVDIAQKVAVTKGQYTLAKMIGIWVAAALPMGVLSWIVFPRVIPNFEANPLASTITRLLLLMAGLIWLSVLSLIIVRQEEGDLSWLVSLGNGPGLPTVSCLLGITFTNHGSFYLPSSVGRCCFHYRHGFSAAPGCRSSSTLRRVYILLS